MGIVDMVHRYTFDIYDKKVFLVGSFPLPLGGVSVHIQRSASLLKSQNNIVYAWDIEKNSQVLPIYLLRLFCCIIKFKPNFIIYHGIHLRTHPLELLVVIVASFFKSKLIVVTHSVRFLVRTRLFYKESFSFLVKYIYKLVLVGKTIKQEMIDFGLCLPRCTVEESPFLPPCINDRKKILLSRSISLVNFMRQSSPLVCISISRFDSWQGGDLYGTDLAFVAFKKLLKIYPGAGLLVVVGNSSGGDEQLSDLPANSYLLKDWSCEMWPLIEKSDLFIRPVRSDSFGISIAEAIYFNTPVVASDVCVRPKETILFKTGCADDLYQKMVLALDLSFQKTNKQQVNKIKKSTRDRTSPNAKLTYE